MNMHRLVICLGTMLTLSLGSAHSAEKKAVDVSKLPPTSDKTGGVSMLVHNVAHAGDPDDYMPPPRNKAGIQPLTKEQIGLIRAWIDQGAK